MAISNRSLSLSRSIILSLSYANMLLGSMLIRSYMSDRSRSTRSIRAIIRDRSRSRSRRSSSLLRCMRRSMRLWKILGRSRSPPSSLSQPDGGGGMPDGPEGGAAAALAATDREGGTLGWWSCASFLSPLSFLSLPSLSGLSLLSLLSRLPVQPNGGKPKLVSHELGALSFSLSSPPSFLPPLSLSPASSPPPSPPSRGAPSLGLRNELGMRRPLAGGTAGLGKGGLLFLSPLSGLCSMGERLALRGSLSDRRSVRGLA
mmetsp:Transcript_34641/g.85892  ORF Transcript_34641/g.85892 Transcript_34641/m.85892 type:complete len:259 (-) Transcript_34641:641-1417(-)